jgi:hypothetical protein
VCVYAYIDTHTHTHIHSRIHTVKILDGQDELSRVEPRTFLGEHLFFGNITKELSTIDEVEDQTQLIVRLEGEM